jgi:hypothetical protein
MEIGKKNKYKNDFKLKLDTFAKELKNYVSTKDGNWTVKGFIDVYKNIYTISSDTKIVSKILEIHIFPKILEFAEKNKYKIILAEQQNWYPDITFALKDNEEVKFAVDIKTTFRRNHNTAGFTLGSHGSYFKERNKAKNIQFPYSEYTGHYCLGIIYTRVDFIDDLEDTKVFQVKELSEEYAKDIKKIGPREVTNVDSLISITSVIKDFDFFAAEKWKISSDKQGSGNTANIGSVNNIDDLKNENGIFSSLGENWFDEYWINYGSATFIKDGKTQKIKSLEDFLIFKGKKELLSKIISKKKKQQL